MFFQKITYILSNNHLQFFGHSKRWFDFVLFFVFVREKRQRCPTFIHGESMGQADKLPMTRSRFTRLVEDIASRSRQRDPRWPCLTLMYPWRIHVMMVYYTYIYVVGVNIPYMDHMGFFPISLHSVQLTDWQLLKIDGWKTTFLLGRAMLALGRGSDPLWESLFACVLFDS